MSKPKLAPKPAAQWPCHGETTPLSLALSLLYGASGVALGSDGSDKESEVDSPPLAKRRKTSLDPIERENRRKIRNRVASQTSRDRKKQHMEDLEKRIELLEEMNQHLIEQNELLRKRSNILEEQNASLSCHHPLTSKSTVSTSALDRERTSPIEPFPDPDEHWCPYNQPPSATPPTRLPPPPPPIAPAPLEAHVAVSREDKGVAAGLTKSAALGCVSLQQKPLALFRSLCLSSWTASMKLNLLTKIDQILAIIGSSEEPSFQETGVQVTEDLFADLFQPEGIHSGEPPASTEGAHVVGGPRPQMESTRELRQNIYDQSLDSLINCFDSFTTPDSLVCPLVDFREQDDADFICKLLSVQERL